MELLGQGVTHRQYGAGVISAQDERCVTVKFDEFEKQFLFPSSFDGFLSMTDKAAADYVQSLIDELAQRDADEKARRLEEEHRRKALAQLAEASEKRAAAKRGGRKSARRS